MYIDFCAVVKRINEEFSVRPLLHGSFGLQRLLREDLSPDDIDVLLPAAFLNGDWPRLLRLMQGEGYTLTDAHEHTFEKGPVKISFGVNDLDGYAGIRLAEALDIEEHGASYTQLNLRQYLAVYQAFSRDRYRRKVKKKHRNDREKIRLIKYALRNQDKMRGAP